MDTNWYRNLCTNCDTNSFHAAYYYTSRFLASRDNNTPLFYSSDYNLLSEFLYNSWKEPDLELSDQFLLTSKDIYFIRVRNRGRGKAEKCVGHLTTIQTEKTAVQTLPPSNRTVWHFGTNDYVLDQDIGYQDDLLLFRKEGSSIIFPSAYTGKKRKEMKSRYEDIPISCDKAIKMTLVIKLEAITGHMPDAKKICLKEILDNAKEVRY